MKTLTQLESAFIHISKGDRHFGRPFKGVRSGHASRWRHMLLNFGFALPSFQFSCSRPNFKMAAPIRFILILDILSLDTIVSSAFSSGLLHHREMVVCWQLRNKGKAQSQSTITVMQLLCRPNARDCSKLFLRNFFLFSIALIINPGLIDAC